MCRHPGFRGGPLSGPPRYARVVEQDDFSLRCERIGHRRIPVVECSREMLEKHQRTSGSAAETAIRIRFVPRWEELGWGRRVAGSRHDRHFPDLLTWWDWPRSGLRWP